jgi:alginate O-acetyltransferase complex protein AlgI
MVFSSNVFLFLFLPVFLAVYYLVPFRWKSRWILLASYTFAAWWKPVMVLLFLAVQIWDYAISWKVFDAHERGDEPRAKRWVTVGIVGDLCAIGFFKYFNFAMDNLNVLLGMGGHAPIAYTHVILPIGISFYTFHEMSYLIDVYRRDAKPAPTFWDFAAFIALFPQLVAGPILRYKDVVDQFAHREHSFAKFSRGSVRLMGGLCKKILIADTLSPLVEAVFSLPQPTMAEAWIGTLAYSLQLYFDFSGYSDMAIGLGQMIGFHFKENFDHPYISRSITEFWRRWHISLSTWLRDYLYVPLGGNRKGAGRTYVNLALTMLLGGLWHGANWTFVLWGAWHGSILALERRFGHDVNGRPPNLGRPLTLILVMLGWVMFRAPDVGTAWGFYAAMAGSHGFAISDALRWQLTGIEALTLVVGSFVVYWAPFWRSWLSALAEERRRKWEAVGVLYAPLFVLAVSRLSSNSYTPFLYFQF